MAPTLYGIVVFGFFIAYYIARYVSSSFYPKSKIAFNVMFYSIYALCCVATFLIHSNGITPSAKLPTYMLAIMSLALPLGGFFMVMAVTILIKPSSIKNFCVENKKIIISVAIVLFLIELVSNLIRWIF